MADKEPMTLTGWECKKCRAVGTVRHAVDAGVYEVTDLLRWDHAALTPTCEFDLAHVRVEAK